MSEGLHFLDGLVIGSVVTGLIFHILHLRADLARLRTDPSTKNRITLSERGYPKISKE